MNRRLPAGRELQQEEQEQQQNLQLGQKVTTILYCLLLVQDVKYLSEILHGRYIMSIANVQASTGLQVLDAVRGRDEIAGLVCPGTDLLQLSNYASTHRGVIAEQGQSIVVATNSSCNVFMVVAAWEEFVGPVVGPDKSIGSSD